ncbi:MAG TPA: potassium channel family protein [Jatrophihabitantaceae bacterium]|nr:potassium channel family protein [Jatrophihabitantaceae bacterium]
MPSERQGQPLEGSSRSLFEELMPDVRRRTIVFAVVRSLAVVTLIVAAYFTLPFNRPRGAGPIAGIVVGLILVATILTLQIRATMRSPYPGMRAFEALASSGPLFLVLFASAHYLIEHHARHSYSQTMTRLDALYFTFTVFTTVGFGDIAPVSELARTVTMLQMVADVLVIFVVARVLFGAVKVGIERRSRSANETPRPQADAAEQSPEPRQGPDG